MAVLILIGIAAVELLGARMASGLLYEARQILHGNFDDRFGSSRIFIWKRAINLIMAKPAFGYGPDSFFQAFAPYQREAFEVADVYFDKAHNEYLQILICTGIAGLTSYMTLLAGAMARGFTKLKKEYSATPAQNNSAPLNQNYKILPYLAAVAAYLLQAFFNISVPITAPLLWVLLGVLAGARRRTDRDS